MKVQHKNLIDIKKNPHIFKNPLYSFSVSSRLIRNEINALKYLQFLYVYLEISQIKTVFGSTTDFSDFYGGRVYSANKSLTNEHIELLSDNNINIALTLTNHFFSEEIYLNNKLFLEKYHKEGNVIICTSDELAKKIRKDFPLYKLRASIIKNANTLNKVNKALELYDDVVIPMDMNDDDDFLESLPEKSRIMLFANASCAYDCPARSCYADISKRNTSQSLKINCTRKKIGTLESAFYFFDVEKFHKMGFTNFKMIPIKMELETNIVGDNEL